MIYINNANTISPIIEQKFQLIMPHPPALFFYFLLNYNIYFYILNIYFIFFIYNLHNIYNIKIIIKTIIIIIISNFYLFYIQ